MKVILLKPNKGEVWKTAFVWWQIKEKSIELIEQLSLVTNCLQIQLSNFLICILLPAIPAI